MNKDDGFGRSPAGPGYSAEPEPSCTVSAVPVSIPNADDPRLQQRPFGYGDSDGRPRSISKRHRAMLSTFTDPIMDRIHAMTDDELWTFIEASQSASMTNCGWDAYAIAKSYLNVAQWEMRTRLASAIDARSDATRKSGAAEGGSAVGASRDAQPPTGDPSNG